MHQQIPRNLEQSHELPLQSTTMVFPGAELSVGKAFKLVPGIWSPVPRSREQDVYAPFGIFGECVERIDTIRCRFLGENVQIFQLLPKPTNLTTNRNTSDPSIC